MENHPDRLASLLNITTAMQQISLPQESPLDYFKNFDLSALAPDRIFGYVDASLVNQVRLAAQQGEFDVVPDIDLSRHGDATSSYKQNEFGEGSYYEDPAAHLLLEVIPNGLTGNVSDPRIAYVLRWIAARHAGVPEFDPLYTIE